MPNSDNFFWMRHTVDTFSYPVLLVGYREDETFLVIVACRYQTFRKRRRILNAPRPYYSILCDLPGGLEDLHGPFGGCGPQFGNHCSILLFSWVLSLLCPHPSQVYNTYLGHLIIFRSTKAATGRKSSRRFGKKWRPRPPNARTLSPSPLVLRMLRPPSRSKSRHPALVVTRNPWWRQQVRCMRKPKQRRATSTLPSCSRSLWTDINMSTL